MGATFTERRPPWVVFTRRDDPWLNTGTAEIRASGGRVFRLDGREFRQPAALFAVFAGELGFPGYFGHNWDALVDCLHDSHDTADKVVLIDHADGLLGADFLGVFVSVLCQAAWRANFQLDADGAPDPDWTRFALHFVFVLDDVPPAAFAQAVGVGMDVKVSVDAGRLTATLVGEDWPEGETGRISG